MSQFVDGVLVRTGDHDTLEQFTSAAEIPVVNVLSDRAHPCEALADLYFLQSRFETIEGLFVTWVGDCTNVAQSFASVCVLAGIDVRIACLPTYRFDDETTAQIRSLGPDSLRFFDDPVDAVEGNAVVYTDVWTSMGQEDEREERLAVVFLDEFQQSFVAPLTMMVVGVSKTILSDNPEFIKERQYI